MFQALAKWAMESQRNAILAVAIALITPLFFWLGAAIAALTVLRHGLKEAAPVLMWGSLPAIAWAGFGDITPVSVLAGAVLMAVVLQKSVNLGATVLFALVAGAAYYIALPSAMPEMVTQLQAQSEEIMAKAFEADPVILEQLKGRVGPLITGALASVIALMAVLCLLLGRWMQSALYNPGGYSKEFGEMRLPATYSVALILMVLIASGIPAGIGGLLPIMTIPPVIAAFALVHGIVGMKQLSGAWLVAFYLCVFLMGPYFYTLLILIALADSVIDIRGRIKDTADPE